MTTSEDRLTEFIPTLENISRRVRNAGTEACPAWIADYNDLRLFSLFQPIYSYALHRQVGFEALIRAYDRNNNLVLPPKIFRGGSINEMLAIDRLCRCLHLANFQHIINHTNAWLFLNVNPLIVSEYIPDRTPFMKEVLELYNIPTNRVVIEVLETAIANETKFMETIKYYREIGCMIAIDDFGAGHSNFNRIWDYHPDFVKLDRSIFTEAVANKKLGKSIPKLVELLHEYGSMVLAEGIETYDQAILCMHAGFDLIQGFLFSEPLEPDQLSGQADEIWPVLKTRYQHHISHKVDERDELLVPLIEEFQHAAMSIRDVTHVESACAKILGRERVIRFYLIDDEGEQKSANIESKAAMENRNLLYAPLQDVNRAIWYHRPYFQKAISNVGEIQVTGPYFSITDTRPCITLSLARKLGGQLFVFCCDIENGQTS